MPKLRESLETILTPTLRSYYDPNGSLDYVPLLSASICMTLDNFIDSQPHLIDFDYTLDVTTSRIELAVDIVRSHGVISTYHFIEPPDQPNLKESDPIADYDRAMKGVI